MRLPRGCSGFRFKNDDVIGDSTPGNLQSSFYNVLGRSSPWFFHEHTPPEVCSIDPFGMWRPGDISGFPAPSPGSESLWSVELLDDVLPSDVVKQPASPSCRLAGSHQCVTSGQWTLTQWGETTPPRFGDVLSGFMYYYEVPLDQYADTTSCPSRISVLANSIFIGPQRPIELFMSWSNPFPNSTANAEHVVLQHNDWFALQVS